MVEMDKIFDIAIERDASDIHLISNNKPVLRIARDLTILEEMDVLKEEDMTELYDYFVRGNIEKDNVFRQTKRLDASAEYKDVRIRINISLANECPVYTLRIEE